MLRNTYTTFFMVTIKFIGQRRLDMVLHRTIINGGINMKELNTEEKAKRYDEAIKRAKELLEIGVKDTRDKRVVLSFFPELKESEDEKMRKSIIYALRNGGFYDNDKTDEAIAWLEKQGEQKPVDKVEPKFKVGDWVVCEFTDSVYQIKDCIEKLSNHKYGYDLTNGGYISSDGIRHHHLWTIEDAKEGDVLVASDDSVFIFARVDGYGCIHHIALANDGVLKINPRLISAWESVRGVKPATQEQCDLLFAKMEEAGYEWNADKKEVIKL